MIFVLLLSFVLWFGLTVAGKISRDSAIADGFFGAGDLFFVPTVISLITVLILVLSVSEKGNELDCRREMMGLFVENADFEKMPDEDMKIVAEEIADINNDLEWYEEHQNSFWYYKIIKLPKDSTRIEVDNPRLMEVIKWMDD